MCFQTSERGNIPVNVKIYFTRPGHRLNGASVPGPNVFWGAGRQQRGGGHGAAAGRRKGLLEGIWQFAELGSLFCFPPAFFKVLRERPILLVCKAASLGCHTEKNEAGIIKGQGSSSFL